MAEAERERDIQALVDARDQARATLQGEKNVTTSVTSIQALPSERGFLQATLSLLEPFRTKRVFWKQPNFTAISMTTHECGVTRQPAWSMAIHQLRQTCPSTSGMNPGTL